MLYLTQALRLGREYNNNACFYCCSVLDFSFFLKSHKPSISLITSAKRFYDSARPITALQCLYKGQTVKAWRGPYLGVGDMNGSDWLPVRFLTCHLFVFFHGNKTCCSSLFVRLHKLDNTVSRSVICDTSIRRICFRALHVQCCLGFCYSYVSGIR
jgi:hypothetical protein